MRWLGVALAVVLVPSCTDAGTGDAAAAAPSPVASGAPLPPVAPTRGPGPSCTARIDELLASGPAWVDSPYDTRRAEVLGRARGEPMVFIREPAPAEMKPRDAARRYAKSPRELRGAVLREGYLFAETPDDARFLSTSFTLGTLFDEPTIHLSRGAAVSVLTRSVSRGQATYRHEDGSTGELLFGDRVAVTREALEAPLHRDVDGLAAREGWSRVRLLTRAEHSLVVEVTAGAAVGRAILTSEGPALTLNCIEESRAQALGDAKAATAGRRAALARLRAAVALAVREELPFDRPIGEKTAEKDGQRRPVWEEAYKRGADVFVAEGGTYPVFDANGEPHPPEVCMEFIVDCFERATGTWYRRRDEGSRERFVGALGFESLGMKNRRGVLAFEAWARGMTDVFDVRRFEGSERVPFGQYASFVRGILTLDAIEPGDVVAIHGRKADGLIHQHGILVLRTDPVTGFPFDLADQMKRARRRTWDGIMAEAPLRSLLYRVRPGPRVLVERAAP